MLVSWIRLQTAPITAVSWCKGSTHVSIFDVLLAGMLAQTCMAFTAFTSRTPHSYCYLRFLLACAPDPQQCLHGTLFAGGLRLLCPLAAMPMCYLKY